MRFESGMWRSGFSWDLDSEAGSPHYQDFLEVSVLWGGIGYIWGEHFVEDHYLHKKWNFTGYNIWGE